ncbi:MAG: DedA family protein [Gemmatimonadetes bacterium]|nr:DedA family protein [Gemmatimonadota bacterium]
MDRLTQFFAEVSSQTLYAILGLVAFVEAIFPPLPADVVVALGAFLAARNGANLYVTIAVIVGGMSAGSAVMYWVARRFGSVWMHTQLKRFGVDTAERQLEALYGRYGLAALFVGRFVPGLRMFVPPVAGMLRVPFAASIAVITLASLIWYGLIAALAFRVGSDWEMFRFSIERLLARVGITAAAFLALATLVVWGLWRQRRFRKQTRDAKNTAERPGPP